MMKKLRMFLALLLMAVCAAGHATDQTYTLDFPLNKSAGGWGFWNTDKEVTSLTTTVYEVDWTIESDSYFMGYTATNGQQLGSQASPLSHAVIWTEGIEGVVKSVAVTARCKDGSTSKVSVKVGDGNYLADGGDAASLSKDNTEFVFTSDAPKSGRIEIIFDQEKDSKAAAINFISAVVTYDPDAVDEPVGEPATWTFEWNTTKANGGEGFYNFGSTFTEETPLVTTINGLTWYAQAEGTKTFAITATGGQTIGSGTANNATHVEFWTEDIEGKVTGITVNTRLNNASYTGHVKVSVGGVAYLCNGAEQADMSNTATDYTFVAPAAGNAEGKVLIELFQTSETRGTLYLKRVDINYLKSDTPKPKAPEAPQILRTGTYTSDYLFDDEDIVITTATEGATIFYTLDSADAETPKDPVTSEERIEYTAPVTITKSTLVRAVAFKDELYSPVTDRTFTMWKNPKLFFEGYADEATVPVGYVGIPVPVSNPYNVGPLNWNSEDETIATVDADGTIHALKEGTVNINFYFDGNDEFLEMGGRLKLTVEQGATYTEGTYTHVWDKSKADGGEGFYNFGATMEDTNTLTASLSGVEWTATTTGSQKMMFTANAGQAFGVATGDPCSHIELVTNGIAGEVTEVIVNAKKGTTSANLSNAAASVSVNGVPYYCNGTTTSPLSADFAEYSFKPQGQPQEGEIKIEVNQDSETQVIVYFRSIVVNYRVEETGIAAPTALTGAGTYDEPVTVELTAEEGTIYFTTDGSNPKTSATAQVYSEPISVEETTTILAIAEAGGKYSPVAEFKYVIRKDAELAFEKEELVVDYSDTFYPGVYLQNPHNVAPIRYESSDEQVVKLDGYADVWPIAPGEATITAYFDGNDEYKPATASYKVVINELEPLEPPFIWPDGGSFTEPVEVTITAGEDWGKRAVTIWYSTECSSPEELEDDYEKRIVWPEAPGFDYSQTSTTITIDKSCTLIAMAKGYNSLTSEPVICQFVIDETLTAINSISLREALADGRVYNLQGARVSRLLKNNIYIIDGKKFVMR